MNKKDFRLFVKSRLESLNESNREILSGKVSENLSTYLPQIISNSPSQNVQVLGGFSPIQKEVLWFKSLFVKTQRVAVPHVQNEKQMSFFEIGIEKIVTKEVGLSLAQVDRAQEVIPDVLLIPALAFDVSFNRLGRGAGYYDRYLESFKGVKIGIGFELQLFESIPVSKFDIKMDYIITEKNIYKNKGK